MSLLKPHFKIHRITDVTLDFLISNNIKALLLDVDNTLSTHHGTVLVEGLAEWIDGMQSGGIKLLVLSNSKEKRVKPFAQKIGLNFISLGLKPLPFGYLRGVKKLGYKRKNVAIIGDQLFTDSLGAHLTGVKAIIADPIKLEDKPSFIWRRYIEKKLYKIYKF